MRTKQPRLNRRLDLDVDGANHIYLLYYTNDGWQPGDVDSRDGTPMTGLSTGVHVAKLAVGFRRSAYGVDFTPLTTPHRASGRALQQPLRSKYSRLTGDAA
jgi:hypothetical protein